MLASTIQFSNNTPHTQSPTTITASNPTWSKKQHATKDQCCSRHPTMHQRIFSLSSVKHQTLLFHALPSAATPPPIGEGVHPPKNTACSTQKNNKLHRKEVIQPHLPVRLPCYDLVPIADPTFDSSLPQGVRPLASGVTNFRDLTGGVYKARERIHRSVADLRLLATPTSWGRVADPNPN